jgi:hypothetical protein
MYKCVTSQVDSPLTDLFTSSWSPSHIDLCHFKVSVLVPSAVRTSNTIMLWVSYLSPYLLCVLYPYHVTEVGPNCCICPRSKVWVWGRTHDFWSSEPGFTLSTALSPTIFLPSQNSSQISSHSFILNMLPHARGYVLVFLL